MLRGKHDTVYIAEAAEGAFIDVLGELDEWLERRRGLGFGDERPLFCWESGAPVRVSELREVVKALMQSIGLDPARFGAHSLRIGGATAALAAGVPPSMIRIMGRWSSDVYEIYCRMSLQAALQVGSTISAAVVDSVEQGFHEEHLELQQAEVDGATAHGLWGQPEDDTGETVPWVE